MPLKLLRKYHKSSHSVDETKSEPLAGDVPKSRSRGQKITPEEVRELRELIRKRYALDVEIWRLKDVKSFQRDYVREKMWRSDAALRRIQDTVESWNHRNYFRTDRDWNKFQNIRDRVMENGKREWSNHPPWEPVEEVTRDSWHGQGNG